eukprot:CAMPEP_0185828594 /NCGR_PEP_ID=MMETSP1322-20130828/32632_1 /TAXON_ID=265543 /ORGANISM="Minutocellus polymorphus, Strain RCC2270" /LENGTH=380 /DNA_ID=CAMNT_0028526335 /DNA_START=94 /DNA_END=1236 /DNA_ORIENTATION=-
MATSIPCLVAGLTRNRAGHSIILRSSTFSTAAAAETLQEQVLVTRSNADEQDSGPNSSQHATRVSSVPPLLSSATELVDGLLDRTAKLVDMDASNNIAFSGGVDSSLAAALVHQVFASNSKLIVGTNNSSSESKSGNVRAVLGLSPAVPEEQVDIARQVAAQIGIELLEIETDEGKDPTYVANAGKACLACKTHLYSALEAVAEAAMTSASASSTGGNGPPRRVILFNGTNADDTRDPTRLGLVAASNFRVESPLLHTTKADVRRAAKHLGLPNHDYAAAPCLRSRLAFGVEATKRHLQAVGEAERRVRAALELDPTTNLRVRMLARNQAMVELDQHVLIDTDAENLLDREGFETVFQELGFASYGVRAFKSGAMAAVAK